MPSTDTSPRQEFAAATEWLADRALGTLTGAGGPTLTGDPAEPPAPRALLAAAQVLGADLLAPALLTGRPADPATATLAAEAHRVFAAQDAPPVLAWHRWATAELLTRAGHPVPAEPPPAPPDEPSWQRWSEPMAQLAPLALPGLTSPLHRLARQRPLDLARATTRAVLRRDHRTALRLTRWLAWLPECPLELPPLLTHLTLTGDGTARSALTLALGREVLGGPA